jgi:phospholipid/cholesterol/gamma-HCH transport system permease protein
VTVNPVQAIGRMALDVLRALGHNAFFFVDLLRHVPAALRRPFLVVAQVHAIGNLSLVIIMSSGLAVGFVLALQSYYALVTYGASESLGLLVNLSLVRELGPVVTALLFAGRAGTSLTAEIGLMKAGECWHRASSVASSRCLCWRCCFPRWASWVRMSWRCS